MNAPLNGPSVSGPATCGECGGAGNQRWDADGNSIPCFPCGGLGIVQIVSEADDLVGAGADADATPVGRAGAGGTP